MLMAPAEFWLGPLLPVAVAIGVVPNVDWVCPIDSVFLSRPAGGADNCALFACAEAFTAGATRGAPPGVLHACRGWAIGYTTDCTDALGIGADAPSVCSGAWGSTGALSATRLVMGALWVLVLSLIN